MQISEIFYSIQGEGLLTGLPTVFIRTTGCNLRCTYCDTTYAYEGGETICIDQILSEIPSYQCNNICITGGEPLIQKETKQLLHALQQKKYKICLETNGSHPIEPITNKEHLMISLDVKTPSSTMHHHNMLENIGMLTKNDQLKCIIQTKQDYEYAKKIINDFKPCCPVIFQPVWGFKPTDLASWILNDRLPVRLGVQLHKILWGPTTHR